MRAWKAVLALAFLWLANLAAPLSAAPAMGPLAARAQELVALLNGTVEPAAAMSPDMLKQLPAAQISASFAQIRAAHGKAVAVESVDAQSASSALATLRTEKARLRLRLAIEPQAPHRLIGLLVEGLETLNDSTDSVVAERRDRSPRASRTRHSRSDRRSNCSYSANWSGRSGRESAAGAMSSRWRIAPCLPESSRIGRPARR